MTIADTTGVTNEKQGGVLGNNFLNVFYTVMGHEFNMIPNIY